MALTIVDEPCPAEQPLYAYNGFQSTTYVTVSPLPCTLPRSHEGYHVCILPDGKPYTFGGQ